MFSINKSNRFTGDDIPHKMRQRVEGITFGIEKNVKIS